MITRRDLLVGAAGATLTSIRLPALLAPPKRTLRLAVITDLHHGLAPDAMSRFQAFADAVRKHPHVDAILQMGDFCYSLPDSKPCLDLWHSLPHTKLSVLGNHDMDKRDEASAVRSFGMPGRYYSKVIAGYRIVVLDLNNFKKDGRLHAYANGNYFADGASCNWADPVQLEWLALELERSREPVILVSHQPLGFAEPGQPVPSEQVEVLNVIRDAKQKGHAPVVVSLFGHLHVDRLETYRDLPCYCVNSASYFWFQGMRPYTRPLYAFLELRPDGVMQVEGVRGEFTVAPPTASDVVLGRSGSITDRTVQLAQQSASGQQRQQLA